MEHFLQKCGPVVMFTGEEAKEITFRLARGDCCKTLEEIRSVPGDETLDDAGCFDRIEKIVATYENAGVWNAARHDSGWGGALVKKGALLRLLLVIK